MQSALRAEEVIPHSFSLFPLSFSHAWLHWWLTARPVPCWPPLHQADNTQNAAVAFWAFFFSLSFFYYLFFFTLTWSCSNGLQVQSTLTNNKKRQQQQEKETNSANSETQQRTKTHIKQKHNTQTEHTMIIKWRYKNF